MSIIILICVKPWFLIQALFEIRVVSRSNAYSDCQVATASFWKFPKASLEDWCKQNSITKGLKDQIRLDNKRKYNLIYYIAEKNKLWKLLK